MGLGDYAVLLGVVPPTFWLMARVGRRTLYIWGLAGMFFGLLIIGGLGVAGDRGNSGAKWGTVAMIYVSKRDFPMATSLISELGLQHLPRGVHRSSVLLGCRRIFVYSTSEQNSRSRSFLLPDHHGRRRCIDSIHACEQQLDNPNIASLISDGRTHLLGAGRARQVSHA